MTTRINSLSRLSEYDVHLLPYGQMCSNFFKNFVILAMSREREKENKVCCAETNSIILLSKRDLTSR